MKTMEILVHIHPELSAEDRAKVAQHVAASTGVVSAHFDKHKHPHALIVEYNTDVVQHPKQILDVVRPLDPAASLIY